MTCSKHFESSLKKTHLKRLAPTLVTGFPGGPKHFKPCSNKLE
jgi:hypothetical protein